MLLDPYRSAIFHLACYVRLYTQAAHTELDIADHIRGIVSHRSAHTHTRRTGKLGERSDTSLFTGMMMTCGIIDRCVTMNIVNDMIDGCRAVCLQDKIDDELTVWLEGVAHRSVISHGCST